MYSLAYVILPFSDQDPGGAITGSLAPFRAGLRGDVPDEWLRFRDETSDVREEHETRYTFALDQHGMSIAGGDMWLIDGDAVRAEMERRGLTRWTVRFAEAEPDLDRFAERFVRRLEQHPVTRGWGRWTNPLGRWDWWDLGGRFDGRITGDRTRNGAHHGPVSSGPSKGRDTVDALSTGVAEASGDLPAPRINVAADNNVELVSTLLDDLRADRDHAKPGTLVLPPGTTADELRWIDTWPSLGPTHAIEALGLPSAVTWGAVVERAYERFADHWAAGVAYHH